MRSEPEDWAVWLAAGELEDEDGTDEVPEEEETDEVAAEDDDDEAGLARTQRKI
jgi:hypothetical protein